MKSTDPRERYARLGEIFTRTLGLPEPRRSEMIRKCCGGDTALRAEVERLLEKATDTGSFLDVPALGIDFSVQLEDLRGDQNLVGRSIAGCRIVRLIDTGGMGSVYEAEQESPRRTVAIKVLKPGLISSSARRRFEHESAVLAQFQHPRIAQIYSAGIHQNGERIPYFVMEFVPNARTITDFAREQELSLHERLRLFIDICDAVHHGHQRGIIHRDLKPDNILISEDGGAKVIDFGIAKSTDSDHAITEVRSEVTQLIGTFQYMSPEQCRGTPQDVDTRTDVYSLGLILYELLAGAPAFDLSSGSIVEALRTVTDETPIRLRDRDRRFAGDLDAIVHTAIAKEKERRYASVAELAADVRRFLHHEPVAAQPPGVVYQLRKLARRHRSAAAGVLVAAAALVIGLVVSVGAAIEVTRQRNEAEEALREARAVSALMLDSMKEWGWATGDQVDVQRLLIDAERFLERQGVQDARTEARLREFVGQGFLRRNSMQRARDNLLRALRIREEELQLLDEELANCLKLVAAVHIRMGEIEAARDYLREMLRVRRMALGPDHMDRAEDSLGGLLLLYVPDEPESRAFEASREATGDRVSARAPGPQHPPGSTDLELIFDEDFEGRGLSSAWETQGKNLADWEVRFEGSELRLVRLDAEESGSVELGLIHAVPPVGAFRVELDFGWEQTEITTLHTLSLSLRADDGVELVHVGYTDGWVGWRGAMSGAFYASRSPFPEGTTTGFHSMPKEGRASLTIERRGEITTVFWDGQEFMKGRTSEPLGRVCLRFATQAALDDPGRFQFEPLFVDRIRVYGQSP